MKSKTATTVRATRSAPKVVKTIIKAAVPSRATRSALPLEKGQLWKMKEVHIEIMEVGKTLTRYRFFKNQVRVPTSLGGIIKVQDYLKTNKAKLIPNPRFAVK